MKLHPVSVILFVAALAAAGATARAAADPVFSGPQPGEKATAFKVADAAGPAAGREREIRPAGEAGGDGKAGGKPVVLVFVHGIERSIVPLVTVVDEYGHQRRETLSTTFVFLSADRTALEKRVPLVGQSLDLKSPLVISVDGAEGPGNYGLNKECLLTIVVAREGKVTANFALVQPGIADAPAVIRAMADASGDANPPTAEALRERHAAGRAATRPAGRPDGRPATRPTTRNAN